MSSNLKFNKKDMQNNQKGFIAPILLAIIALLVIGGGAYIYQNKYEI